MGRYGDDRDDLAALADELLHHAAEIRKQWSELAAAAGIDAAPLSPAPREDNDNELVRMRLVALDMMLAGAARGDVAVHLRETFGDHGVDAVVDEVFSQYGDN